LCSVHDNLYVMAAVEAAYLSHATGTVVRVSEIMGERWDGNYGSGASHGFADWVPPTREDQAP